MNPYVLYIIGSFLLILSLLTIAISSRTIISERYFFTEKIIVDFSRVKGAGSEPHRAVIINMSTGLLISYGAYLLLCAYMIHILPSLMPTTFSTPIAVGYLFLGFSSNKVNGSIVECIKKSKKCLYLFYSVIAILLVFYAFFFDIWFSLFAMIIALAIHMFFTILLQWKLLLQVTKFLAFRMRLIRNLDSEQLLLSLTYYQRFEHLKYLVKSNINLDSSIGRYFLTQCLEKENCDIFELLPWASEANQRVLLESLN